MQAVFPKLAPMEISWTEQGQKLLSRLEDAIDLSLPVDPVGGLPRAWYQGPATENAVRNGDWIGSVEEGGTVNFFDQQFNPHAHCTHTETLGHIHGSKRPLSAGYPDAHVFSVLVTLEPENNALTLEGFTRALRSVIQEDQPFPVAVVIRTHTGAREGLLKDWSNTNPPHLEKALVDALVEHGAKHLLVDLPSVDPEVDGGALVAHHAFFGLPDSPRVDATITELIAVPPSARDGIYLLNLQVAPWVNDAAPSRPLLFPARWA